MIFYIVEFLMKLDERLGFLRVLKYITFRSAMALILAFVLSLVLGPIIIRRLAALRVGQQIRKIQKPDAPDLYVMHHTKAGTPTMGGILIIITLLIPVLLLCSLESRLIWILIIMTLGFGTIGFFDDWLKIKRQNAKGLGARVKLACQLGLGLALGIYLYRANLGIFYPYKAIEGNTFLCIPFFKDLYPNLGIFFIAFVMLVITATSNAVNLTDGLDGLAIGITTICALSYGVITYLVGRADFARYLLVPFIPNGGEITVFLGGVVGAGMGFLWFNAHPAQVFMGDTGSLTLGGLLGTIALLTKQEFLLFVIGGIFVLEALSVIIQVVSYKCTGKRVFLMSPLHHHYERLGLAEAKIIARFWIISALLALFGLSMLKLR
jgi:phospho-N-acetylmuramoyl-pentapeptide-transferase